MIEKALQLFINFLKDELGIDNSSSNKKKTYDVDLDAFMNPDSGSIFTANSHQGRGGDTFTNVQQLIQAAK
jgi:hypothetical protein